MSKFRPEVFAAFALIAGAASAEVSLDQLGRPATPDEIAAWDIDVRPDGLGLPPGSGSVADGEGLYDDFCASCHGYFGEGMGRWPELAGGFGTLDAQRPVKTTGSYWPYVSTIWDYVHRAMPFTAPASLTPEETYSLTAYILYLDDLVDEDFVLTPESFDETTLPNEDGFIRDDRLEVEFPLFTQEACMTDCKTDVKITMRATVLDVTPDAEPEGGFDLEGGAGVAVEEEASEPEGEAAVDVAEAEADVEAEAEADTEAAAEAEADAEAAPDPELVAAGERVFRKCQACHQVGENAKNRVGPVLNGVVGGPIGAVEGFRYSDVFQEAHADGETWTPDQLAAFLADPRQTMPGTKMTFAGLKADEDIAAVIAYIQSASN